MPAVKISIALDERQLRIAKKAAKTEGLSLSAYIARALSQRLQEQERLDAARKLHATWGPETVPTADDMSQFLALMQRPKKSRKVA